MKQLKLQDEVLENMKAFDEHDTGCEELTEKVSVHIHAIVDSARNRFQAGHGHETIAGNSGAYCKVCGADIARSGDSEVIHQFRRALTDVFAIKAIHQLAIVQSDRLYREHITQDFNSIAAFSLSKLARPD